MSSHARLLVLVLGLVTSLGGLGCGGPSGQDDAGQQDASQQDAGQQDASQSDVGDAVDAGELTPAQVCENTCAECMGGLFLGQPTCGQSGVSCVDCEPDGDFTPGYLPACEANMAACITVCSQQPQAQRPGCNANCSMSRQTCLVSGSTQCATGCNACYQQLTYCMNPPVPATPG